MMGGTIEKLTEALAVALEETAEVVRCRGGAVANEDTVAVASWDKTLANHKRALAAIGAALRIAEEEWLEDKAEAEVAL